MVKEKQRFVKFVISDAFPDFPRIGTVSREEKKCVTLTGTTMSGPERARKEEIHVESDAESETLSVFEFVGWPSSDGKIWRTISSTEGKDNDKTVILRLFEKAEDLVLVQEPWIVSDIICGLNFDI